MSPRFNKIMAAICFLLCGLSLIFLVLRLHELRGEPISETIVGYGVLGNILTFIGTGLTGFVFVQRLKDPV